MNKVYLKTGTVLSLDETSMANLYSLIETQYIDRLDNLVVVMGEGNKPVCSIKLSDIILIISNDAIIEHKGCI